MKTFPANLMLSGKRCLVVGGGKVAARKIGLLADAGAAVAVVARELSPAAQELCAKAGASATLREFDDSDLDGSFLVFAATDSSALNARIASLCAAKGLLCCAIDASWPAGSFITPASFEAQGVKVSISTGGASCRKSKILKESLARHIRSVESSDLFVAGFDHSLLNLESRAKLRLEGAALERACRRLARVWGLHEFMVLSTCNRFEVLGAASQDPDAEDLLKSVLGFDALPASAFYIKRSWEAFAHLPSVAAGMLSQTPGEKHVVAQLKEAFEAAKARAWAGPLLQDWLDASLHISKHIRAEIEPLFQSFEIEELALRFAEERLGSLEGRKTLLLGSGQVGSALAEALRRKGASTNWLFHSKAPSDACEARVASLSELPELLPEASLLIAATSSQEPLLSASDAPRIAKGALLLDLSLPPNIDPALKGAGNFQLFNLDDLKFHQRRELAELPQLLSVCAKTIEGHRELYAKIVAGLKGGDAFQPAGPDSN